MPTVPRLRTVQNARSAPRAVRAALAVLAASCAILLAAAGLSGCSGKKGPTGPAPAYSSIVISGPDSVLIDGTVAFTAVVVDTAGQPVAFPQLKWSSSATGIATVNNAGTAQGVSEGDVTITASGGGVTSNARPLAVYPGYGWIDQSGRISTVSNLRGVHFVSAREGWIVGDQGTILHTADAGRTWTSQNSNSTGYTLNAVWFVSPTIGIVVGGAGRVLRTTNGGTTWSAVTVDSDGGRGLNHVYFQDDIRGWIVGNGGVILRTSNSGASWTRTPSVTIADLERVSFPRASGAGPLPADPYACGWAVGAGGTILGSDDFGVTWRLYVPFVSNDYLYGVTRRGKTAATAIGNNNRALYTVASGDSATWQLAAAPTPFSNLFCLAGPGLPGLRPGTLWAGGKRTDQGQPVILRTDDDGMTWMPQALPAAAPLAGNTVEDVYFQDAVRGWAVGTQGLVLHTVNGGE